MTLLRQCIESLYANTPLDQFTCTVLDDESSDFRLKKYLRSITHRNFSLLEVSNSGNVLSQLKNTAVAYSEQRFGRGDFLHLGDSDVYFMPGWMDKLTRCALLTEPKFTLWGGQIHPFHQPLEGSPLIYGDGKIEGQMTEHSILDGPSWLMRWATWDLCGPLDRTTAPGACQSEEYGFCERLTKRGIKHNDLEFGHPDVWYSPARIGVIIPHCVIHTGLTQSSGAPAPGAAERRALIPPGVIAE